VAHAGPYEAMAEHVYLLAEQTYQHRARRDRPLSFRGDTMGTVQEFQRVGPGEGELYDLADGALAFVDGHFLLVEGEEQGVVTGDGNDVQLNVNAGRRRTLPARPT